MAIPYVIIIESSLFFCFPYFSVAHQETMQQGQAPPDPGE